MARLAHRTLLARVDLPSFALACLFLLLPGSAFARTSSHGGAYQGPGNTIPPGAGSGTAGVPARGGLADTVPPPATPHTPADCAPTPPSVAPAEPGFAAPDPTSSGGMMTATPDLTRWDYWWAFNRDPFLALKSAIASVQVDLGSDDSFLGVRGHAALPRTRRPSLTQVEEQIYPALLHALDTSKHVPVISGSLIAIARIGRGLPPSEAIRISQRLIAHLDHPTQEVHESAALCLGLLGDRMNLDALVALVHDTPEGRRLVGELEVDVRTRAFAAYGLGLLGQAIGDLAVRQRIVAELVRALDAPNAASRDLKVACMISFGLVPLELDPGLRKGASGGEVLTLEQQIAYLADFLDARRARADARIRHDMVRAHAPRAIVRLLEHAPVDGLPEERARVARLLGEILGTHSPFTTDEVLQGAALAAGALGRLGTDPADLALRKALATTMRKGSEQSRRFALVGLGHVGGRPGLGDDPFAGLDEVRTTLRRELLRETSPRRPWAALAIGIQGRLLHGEGLALDPATSKALLAQAQREEDPEVIGAYALALGLRRDLEALDFLLERLDALEGRDAARGYCAVALGMMDAKDAADPILELVRSSRYRPELIRQASTGLALLRQVHAVPELVSMLADSSATSSQAALCGALGRIGDRDAVAPLLAVLRDDDVSANARSFAAVALGLIGDPDPLPWNVELSRDVHYRATTETLIGDSGGVLDLF